MSGTGTAPANSAGANAAAEASGIMGALGNAGKVFGAFNGAVAALGSIQTLIGMFSGAKSDTEMMLEAIGQLTKVVQAGFDKIGLAITDQTQQQRWQAYANQFHAWQTTIQKRANELKTVTANGDTINVTAGGRLITLQQWCEGYRLDDKQSALGVLDELGDLMSDYAAWITPDSVGAPSPLDLWSDLSAAASQANFPGFAGENLYTLLFSWTQSLYGLVSGAAYVRNAALLLYRTVPPSTSSKIHYTNLDAALTALGNVNDPGSVWGHIEAKFNEYRAKGFFNDDRVCAMASSDAPQDMSQDIFKDVGINDGWAFFWALPAYAPSQCYVTDLQLLYVETTTRIWYLEATVVQLNPDGTVQPLAQRVNSLAPVYTSTSFYSAGRNGIGLPKLAAAAGYVSEPPVDPDPNLSNVVTGFQISNFGGYLTLALQYGVLDASDPNKTIIKINDHSFHQPASFNGGFWLGSDASLADLRVAGTASHFPLTNASFIQLGNRLTLLTRNAWTGYRADCFQPSKLINPGLKA